MGRETGSGVPPGDRPVITPGEMRVLELAAAGLTSEEIAHRCGITRQAVTFHLGNMFRKFGVTNRAGLVGRAYDTGTLMAGVWPPQASR